MRSRAQDDPASAGKSCVGAARAQPQGRIVVLLARSAFAAAPFRAMSKLADAVASLPHVSRAVYAFSEQGEPSLYTALTRLADEGVEEAVLLPMILPMEPGFATWLGRALDRWGNGPRRIPRIRIGGSLGAQPGLVPVLAEMIASAEPPRAPRAATSEAALVPAQQRRVLVCHGGPCSNAGAAAIWVHLRNEQRRLSLRDAGAGTMTAKATCLGPCGLAPVMQVWPEGTIYGGVDERGLDRIIAAHLLDGRVLDELAYHPTGRKQRLRRPSEP
jgi:(2Fe-2S) ferredoxin